MRLTRDFIASEFIAAAESAGMKQVAVLVGRIGEDQFLVTVTLKNPVSVGHDDQYLVSSCPYEFDDEKHVKQIAAAKARMFAEAIPTIH